MSGEGDRGLRIFLQYSLFIAVIAGFNLYNYFTGGGRLFLIMGLASVAGLIGWAIFYFRYVRAEKKPGKD